MIAMLRRRFFQKKKKCKVVFNTGGGASIQTGYPQGNNNYIEIMVISILRQILLKWKRERE